MMKILFIGADPQTFESVGANLAERWPEVKIAQKANVADSLELLDGSSADAVLLYANFPDLETSAQAIRRLRQTSNIPLMVLSPQKGEQAVVTALHFGADDYVKLPCETPELMARISFLLMRAGPIIPLGQEQPIFISSIVLKPSTKEVLIGNQSVELTPSQFKLLNRLLIVPMPEAPDGLKKESWLQNKDSGPLEKYARHVTESDDPPLAPIN